jgi:hypothetical protein
MEYRTVSVGLLIAAASSAAGAAEADWYLLTERPGYVYFADAASVTKSDQTVEMEFLQGHLDSPPGGEHILLRYRIDCSKQMLRMLSGRVFMDDGSEIPDLTLPGAPTDAGIDTVSPGKAFHDFACSGGHRDTRVDDPFQQIRQMRAELYGDESVQP